MPHTLRPPAPRAASGMQSRAGKLPALREASLQLRPVATPGRLALAGKQCRDGRACMWARCTEAAGSRCARLPLAQGGCESCHPHVALGCPARSGRPFPAGDTGRAGCAMPCPLLGRLERGMEEIHIKKGVLGTGPRAFCSRWLCVQERRRREAGPVLSGFPQHRAGAGPAWPRAAGLFALLTCGMVCLGNRHSPPPPPAPHSPQRSCCSRSLGWGSLSLSPAGFVCPVGWSEPPHLSLVPTIVSPHSARRASPNVPAEPEAERRGERAGWAAEALQEGGGCGAALSSALATGIGGAEAPGGRHGETWDEPVQAGAAAGCWRERGHAACTAGAYTGPWRDGCRAGAAPAPADPLLQSCRDSGAAVPGGWLGEELPVSKVMFQFLL